MKQAKNQKKLHKPVRRKAHKLHRLSRALKFLPAVLILVTAYGVHGMPSQIKQLQPVAGQVLSYATAMNVSDLFSQTNVQRSGNGMAGLSLSNALNSAAQAKANDMVTRDYWSHTTPDGNDPWVFMTNAGYQYKTAGENLAYGFDNGTDTITGWMNSPPHRQNLLNSAFSDVGFGFANSPNYVGNGAQTVVVSMYGAPLNQAPPAAQPAKPPATSAQTKPAVTTQATPPPASSEPIQTTPVPEATPAAQTTDQTATNPVETASVPVASTAKVRRIQVLTGGNAVWSSTLLVVSLGGVGILWVLQRGVHLKRYLQSGEQFVLHHIHLDMTVVSLFILGATLLQTTGTVR